MARRKQSIVIAAAIAQLLASGCASSPAHSAPKQALSAQVEFDLPEEAKVSINIYDSDGRLVRDLVHGETKSAGSNTVLWDGRDNAGRRLPRGEYTWKLLGTKGLRATYLTSLGTNPNMPWESWPGNYGGIYAVACDGQSLYFGSCGQSTIMLVKQSMTGKRQWAVPSSYQEAQGPIALGRSNDKLFMLQPNGMVYRIDADTADYVGRFNAAWVERDTLIPSALTGRKAVVKPPPPRPALSPSAMPMDLASNDDYVIVSYYGYDAIRWFQPSTGRLVDEAVVAKPLGVAIDKQDRVLVITGGTVTALGKSDKKAKVIIDGVPDAYRLAINAATGDILVAMQGATQQVSRYTADGKLIRTFGRYGGRHSGDYVPEDFSNVTDIAPDPSGGFVISEADAPRRVVRFNPDGTIRREWDGPQSYAPYAQIDPAGATSAWGDSELDHLIRYRLNLAAKSWSVAGVYSYDTILGGLFSDPSARPKGWRILHHGGDTFLARANPFRVVRVDPEGVLTPVAAIFAVDTTTKSPVLAAALKERKLNRAALLWTDKNRNEKLDSEELMALDEPAWLDGKNQTVLDDFTVAAIDAEGLHKLLVDRWKPAGIPRYTTAALLPLGHGSIRNIDPEAAAVDENGAIWSIYNADDSNGQRVRGLVRWDSDGLPTFKVGVSTVTATSSRYLSHIVGTPHGCVAVADPANGTVDVWDENGLWVGQFFEYPDFAAAPRPAYRLNPHFLGHSLYVDPHEGDVYLVGSSVNNNPVIRITGWNDWLRQGGDITLK
ncbi:MAG TPA: FlgD immunoglobulin-like domain containing protein [Capsulimonadaceae bacterium]|jgi:hypothetical protein